MITLPLNKYYFIIITSTVITITNQSYHFKHILHIYSIIIVILSFCRLKNTPIAVGPRGPMLSYGRNSPKRTRA